MSKKQELQKKYGITYPGRKTVYVNPDLCDRRKIDDAGLKRIKDLHYAKEAYFNEMEQADDVYLLRKFAKQVTRIEYQLQEAWGFKKNRFMHEWYLVPKCKCPKMDNAEARGTKYQIISGNCPIHWTK